MVRKIQINLQKRLFLNFWFWESSNEMKHTCFWVIFDLLNHGCCSVAHSCPILCDPHGLQHTRLSCLSLSSGVCSNSCPLSWYHLILCPLLFLLSLFPIIRIFSSALALHIRWPEYWSFSFSISPSNEHSGLISFKIDCFVLLAVQGTLKSLLQHHRSKGLIL